jgi:hypothetical protein
MGTSTFSNYNFSQKSFSLINPISNTNDNPVTPSTGSNYAIFQSYNTLPATYVFSTFPYPIMLIPLNQNTAVTNSIINADITVLGNIAGDASSIFSATIKVTILFNTSNTPVFQIIGSPTINYNNSGQFATSPPVISTPSQVTIGSNFYVDYGLVYSSYSNTANYYTNIEILTLGN